MASTKSNLINNILPNLDAPTGSGALGDPVPEQIIGYCRSYLSESYSFHHDKNVGNLSINGSIDQNFAVQFRWDVAGKPYHVTGDGVPQFRTKEWYGHSHSWTEWESIP